MSDPGLLILLRHGQSTANAAGLFTGVLNVPLTARGRDEAFTAASLLRAAKIQPGVVFTSAMTRTRQTAAIVAAGLGIPDGVVVTDWRLNERSYGALTGQTKVHVLREFGVAQFVAWRRSVDIAPPPMSDRLFSELASTPLFRSLPADALTRTESLRDVMDRIAPLYVDRVQPALRSGHDVLLIGHGNSLRALCGIIDDLDDATLRRLNIPTGYPLIYNLDDSLRPTNPGGRYLAASDATAAALALAIEGGT